MLCQDTCSVALQADAAAGKELPSAESLLERLTREAAGSGGEGLRFPNEAVQAELTRYIALRGA